MARGFRMGGAGEAVSKKYIIKNGRFVSGGTYAFSDWFPGYNARYNATTAIISYGDDYIRMYATPTGSYDTSRVSLKFYGWSGFSVNPGDIVHVEANVSYTTEQYSGTPIIGEAIDGAAWDAYKVMSNTTGQIVDFTYRATNTNWNAWLQYDNATGTLAIKIYNIWIERG